MKWKWLIKLIEMMKLIVMFNVFILRFCIDIVWHYLKKLTIDWLWLQWQHIYIDIVWLRQILLKESIVSRLIMIKNVRKLRLLKLIRWTVVEVIILLMLLRLTQWWHSDRDFISMLIIFIESNFLHIFHILYEREDCHYDIKSSNTFVKIKVETVLHLN